MSLSLSFQTRSCSSSPPTSSCLKDAFIHNHLERKGGPQSDRGGAAAGASASGGKVYNGYWSLQTNSFTSHN